MHPTPLPESGTNGTGTEVTHDPLIRAGFCYALFAYDVGLGIDLDAASLLVRELTQRDAVRHQRPTPRYFNFTHPPLRTIQQGDPIAVGQVATRPRVEMALFDFGAVSVTYQLPLGGLLSGLLAVSSELYENTALLDDSRRRVTALLDSIASAVHRPRIADFVEDYAIFQIAALDMPPGRDTMDVVASSRLRLAQILRAETQPLSAEEVDDALASRIAYGPGETVIIDWNGAVLFHKDIDDIRAVLEYVNVELLELRWLDNQLDLVLNQSYDALARRGTEGRWRRSFPLIPDREVRRIAQLQMDNALLFEGVSNALKLQAVDSIYQKLSDQAATRRLEVLEWIIILLIALSIVMMFM
jgi:hypothetical protein